MRKKYDAAPPPPTAAECSRFLQLTGFGGKLFLRVNIVPASFVFPNIFTFFICESITISDSFPHHLIPPSAQFSLTSLVRHLTTPEVGINKRKQENKNSSKKVIKKTRKQERKQDLDQESDQEKKEKTFS